MTPRLAEIHQRHIIMRRDRSIPVEKKARYGLVFLMMLYATCFMTQVLATGLTSRRSEHLNPALAQEAEALRRAVVVKFEAVGKLEYYLPSLFGLGQGI